MNNYRTIQQKDMHNFFLSQEKNIPALGTKCSQPRNKTALRLALSLLLLFVLGINTAWGQDPPVGTDRSGIFYFVNRGSGKSGDPKITNETNPDNYFYLVPADNPQQDNKRDAWFSSDYSSDNGDPEKPYLTTYKTKKDAADVPEGVTNRPHNSVWIVKFASTDSGTDYYYLIHAATGKYVVYEPPYSAKKNRKSMHLLTTVSPDENATFAITTNSDYYNFRPKNVGTEASTNKYLNPTQQNYTAYYSSDLTVDGAADYFRGLIGLWKNNGSDNADGTGSDWKLEATLLTAPTINFDPNTNTFSISYDKLPNGYIILYTLDGSDPTIGGATTSTYSGSPVLVTESITVKAVVARYGMVLTEVASEVVTPTQCNKPVITFDNTSLNVSITCATPNSTIYYTTDGSTPTTSSTLYSSPFPVNSPTTVKAIATHSSLSSSAVAELAITQVATPTIQNNGSNAISITSVTPGATVYYTTDGSNPTTSSTEYTEPLTNNVSNVTIKAIAVKENMITSAVGSGSVILQCATPVITRNGLKFTLSCSMPTDATFYYSLDGTDPATPYNGAVSFTSDQLPITVTAVAKHNDYTDSEIASLELKNGEGTPEDPYLIYGSTDFSNFITNVNNGGDYASASYKLGSDVSASGSNAITTEFTGTFDGDGYTISNLGHALFNSVNGGTVKNVMLDVVSISGGTNAGAIANQVTGTSEKLGCIYNCGVLSGSVSGSGYVGGIVGQLGDSNNDDNCYARVINCFSYATISGGSVVGGIVGYNDFASTASNIRTMVMNCMFYGDITGGTTVSPVYGGSNIDNKNSGGLATYNYFADSQLKSSTIAVENYNCALGMEDRFIVQCELYRLLLNSNKKLAAFYATGSPDNADQKMMKWVLETADRSISGRDPYPYPILKAQGYYPSIINYDVDNAPTLILENDKPKKEDRNKGGKLGKTISVTIKAPSEWTNAPSDAKLLDENGDEITTSRTFPLQRTDKDFDRFNYNYDKVQLPYYNDYGTKNYTGNKVVTGWKITSITGGTAGTFNEADDWGGYNFADRNCTNKDLYDVSGRVFSQGAYFDVPYGVTGITIEPYWAVAAYVSDQYYDVVYKENGDSYYAGEDVTVLGTQATNSSNITINGSSQKVYTSINNARNSMNIPASGKTVYDYAVVLVGNVHQASPLYGSGDSHVKTPYTIMSVDLDKDNEPDYSFIFSHHNRQGVTPIRFDFLNVVGTAQAQKPNGTGRLLNVSVFKPKGWFEITNTCSVFITQFEADNGNKDAAPVILLGGMIDQYTSTQYTNISADDYNHRTSYIHVGSNACFNEFGNGTHSDGW